MIKNRRLLIPVLFAVVLTVRAEVPGKDGVAVNGISQLFPAADVKLEPNDGGAVRMEGDVAVVDVAPERLYLGCRFHNSYPAALRATAKYCDVVSFNCYRDLPETHRSPADAVDKPTIIGEFHFGSLDRGSLHAGLVPCCDMKDRIEHYKAYVRAALKDRNLVGVHWFFWSDMPLTGWMDGEDFMTGVLTVTDTPYPEMVEATRELARELYPQPAKR